MLSLRSLLVAALSAPLLVLAQEPNAFIIPTAGLSATAGKAMNLTWTPSTDSTVTLILRSGASNDLAAGTVVASKISNSGQYTWNVPSSITQGSDYTVEIVDDSDPSQTNYTPYFFLESDVTSTYSTPQVTLGAASTTLAASTASPTGAAASLASTASSGSMTTSVASGNTATTTVAVAVTSAATSAATTLTNAAGVAASSSPSGSASGSAAAAATSSSSDSDTSSSASSTSSSTTSTETGAINGAGFVKAPAAIGLAGVAAFVALLFC